MNYNDSLNSFYESDPSLFVITAENRALIRNIEKEYPNLPFLDVGIAEQTAIGVAAGLAKCGRKPIVHALAAFLTMRAYEFIRTDIGIPSLDVKMVGFIPGLLSEANGPTHQAIQDLALMQTIPGMQLYTPSDYEDLIESLPIILSQSGPAYIRAIHTSSNLKHTKFILGKAEKLFDGNECSILTYGILTNQCMSVVKELEKHKINCSLYNFRSLNPLDNSLLDSLFENRKPIIVIEDHMEYGSLYAKILNKLAKINKNNNVLGINLGESYHDNLLIEKLLNEGKFSVGSLSKQIINFLDNV